MGNRVVVLGCGRVGSAMARDLADSGEFEVVVVDRSPQLLSRLTSTSPGITTVEADLLEHGAVSRVVADADLVVGAVPGFMGFRTLKGVLEAGRDVVDISFFEEDPMELDGLAREKDVRCLVDFGIAPGCTNLVFGHVQSRLARIRSFECYVGGLPLERALPWQYKAPFSPVDVLEEYIRAARLVIDGEIVTRPAMSEPEMLDFEGLGTLEGFLTDTLRTLLTDGVEHGLQYMVEKTLRYPGHRDRILTLIEAGLLKRDPIIIDGTPIAPLDVTGRLLVDAWEMGEGDEDLTAFRVVATGEEEDGGERLMCWEMLDRYDLVGGVTSMARTTGYTCTGGVRLLRDGLWEHVGVTTPQMVGRDDRCYRYIMDRLEERGVVFESLDCNPEELNEKA